MLGPSRLLFSSLVQIKTLLFFFYFLTKQRLNPPNRYPSYRGYSPPRHYNRSPPRQGRRRRPLQPQPSPQRLAGGAAAPGRRQGRRPPEKSRRISRSRSRSRSPSGSRSRSPPAPSPKRAAKSRSPSSSRGGAAGKGLVSYGDGSPDSAR
ncbi:unnamed protein product [Spirodela intermedia]|uniref:Uncharacterized protein n=1 Tax=Spirodela intermedia TaxID=51605 RepID=A0A7I8J8F3_SPIIN|nr:unnamed protein product [Spirodela intermedia]CAA6666364.1 unnamed protein product [Spirodela intermedia]